ncbi:hypothetical protein AAULR_23976 [Lacticaseibacillus rhamnosus MTCC 5462]|nr:hypothetical protein AAULR_23976 [Lacticaseibacillus rhamnosus MTCC 5462]
MVNTMKAAVWLAPVMFGTKMFRFLKFQTMILIKVAYSGVCGSDLPRSQKEMEHGYIL